MTTRRQSLRAFIGFGLAINGMPTAFAYTVPKCGKHCLDQITMSTLEFLNSGEWINAAWPESPWCKFLLDRGDTGGASIQEAFRYEEK